MNTQKVTWPDNYPDKCPPVCAVNVSGKVIRLTNRSNPKSKDFCSYYEQNPNHNWGEQSCQARGLSVYTSEEEYKYAISVVPALKRKKVCIAELSPKDGVIASTPSTNNPRHKTYWPLLSNEQLSEIFKPLNFEEVVNA